MAFERLQYRIPFFLGLWQHEHPSRYASFELLSYYAQCRCEHKRTAIRLERSLLDRRPIVQHEPLRVVEETPETRAIIRLSALLVRTFPKLEDILTETNDSNAAMAPDDVLDNVTLFWLTNSSFGGTPLLGEQARLFQSQGRHRPSCRERVPRRTLPEPPKLGGACLSQPRPLQQG